MSPYGRITCNLWLPTTYCFSSTAKYTTSGVGLKAGALSVHPALDNTGLRVIIPPHTQYARVRSTRPRLYLNWIEGRPTKPTVVGSSPARRASSGLPLVGGPFLLGRLRVRIERQYRVLRRIYHRAVWAACLARLALRGALTMAGASGPRAWRREGAPSPSRCHQPSDPLHTAHTLNKPCPILKGALTYP
jgi:hypothetical protein